MSSDKRGARAPGRPRSAGMVAVARVLGVSPSTVSNAYNRPDQLSRALRERVLRTAAQLGYAGPDPVARSLRSGRAGAIGVVFPERLAYPFDDPAAVRFLQGLSDAADERQLAVVLVPGPPDRAARGQGLRNAAVDGFILHSLPDDDPSCRPPWSGACPRSWSMRRRPRTSTSSASTTARPPRRPCATCSS